MEGGKKKKKRRVAKHGRGAANKSVRR